MSRLSVQSADEWIPIRQPRCIGALDRTTAQATAAFGWVWDEVEEEGLGPTFYVLLAWDSTSRFELSASGFYPEDGIAIDVDASEEPASARQDFLDELDLTPKALLALSERGVWFARWDPPNSAGDRPSTATLRPFDA